MHLEVLPPRVRRLCRRLVRLPALRPFYLAGETGLALHLGHRRSEDLDFFSRRLFRPPTLARALAAIDVPKHLSLGQGSVEGWLGGFKMQLLHYPYRLLNKLHQTELGPLADPLDIALMKLTAVSQRGSKRDFVDLVCFMRSHRQFPLHELLQLLPQKYGRINRGHYLRALVYFQDAEREPMPRMRRPLSWKEVKDYLRQGVAELLRP